MADKSETEKKVEKQTLKVEDVEKAKRKGSLFGDPIFVVE
jgi:hypothetical protein